MSPARKTGGEKITCPWCSASVPAASATCPSCGAQLRDAAEGDILGVTQIDPSAVSRVRRVKPRRLTAWLTGEGPVEDESTGGKIEPPSEDVRREMLRLELAAIDAELEAKAAQAAANRELPPDETPGTAEPAEPGPS